MELWEQADVALSASRIRNAKNAAADLEWLRIAKREGTHKKRGFGSFVDYVATTLGLENGAAYQHIQVADALGQLPRLQAAMADGRLVFSAMRELYKVATPDNEAAWLERAVGQTVKAIAAMVQGRELGDGPDTPANSDLMTTRRTIELSNATHALLLQAKLLCEKDLGHTVSEDQLFAELAKLRIATAKPDTSSSTVAAKVVVTVCPECEGAHQLAGGQLIRIDPDAFTHLDFGDDDFLYSPSLHVDKTTKDIPAAVRRWVFIRDRGCCKVPGCSGRLFLHFHHIRAREDGGPHEAWNIVLWCSSHHLAFHDGRLVTRGQRAGELSYFHSDGLPYGILRDPQVPA